MASFPRILSARAWRAGAPALLFIGMLTGCPASGDDLQPPRDELVFPTALAVSPDGSRLFAVNANSDLRWSSGSVVVLDLVAVDDLASRWIALPVEERGCGSPDGPLAGEPCACDLDDPTILACDQSRFTDPGAGVRVGNFATDLAIQQLADGALRLFVPVRGDPSVTWIDYRDGELACDGTSEGFPLCDDERILGFADDPTRALFGEPFGVYVDPVGEYAVVTHLERAGVSLIHAPDDGTPALVDALTNLFAADSLGIQAATGVAGRRLADPLPGDDTLLYVTSRTEDRIQMLAVSPPRDSIPPQLVPAGFLRLDDVQPSNDSRGIAFDDDGTRAFLVNRNPPMLHVMDTAATPAGAPANRIIASIELCRDPANLAVAKLGEDTLADTRVYVACFPEGQVWIIDPKAARVEAILSVGGGPHALTVDRQRNHLYVANYLDHSLAVIDIDPASPVRHQIVLRLRSSQEEGEN